MDDVKKAIFEAKELFYYRFQSSPEEINQGKCELFAEEVSSRVDRVEIVGDPGRHVVPIKEVPVKNPEFLPSDEPVPELHVWVYDPKTEKHHDAECPEGVSDWQDLPFYN